jgi:predicted dehydrogenase
MIAGAFVDDLVLLTRGEILAVASRTLERAQEFGAQHGIERCHGSYEELAADPEIDIVYVASPHSRHARDTIMFLEAGKHVLCEKPFALNAHEAAAMVSTAELHDRFLMEAMWSRFLPANTRLRELLDGNELGEPLALEASFGFRAPFDPHHRLFDPALGGGALLDLGIYPLQLDRLVFGAPDEIIATAHLGETAVDEQVAVLLRHPGGGIATVSASLRANLPCDARVSFSDGSVTIPSMMHWPQSISITRGNSTEHVDASFEGIGLRFQAEEVHRCLDAGLRDSSTMPLADTCALAQTMDAVRAQIGVTYDADLHGHSRSQEDSVE